MDGATIFVNRTGGAIREFLFVDAEQAYVDEVLAKMAARQVKIDAAQAEIDAQ